MKTLLFILSLLIIGCNKIKPTDQFGLAPKIEDHTNPGGDPDQPIHSLIVIAGESNAGGEGRNDSLSAYELAPRISVKILNNNNLLFETLDIGTNNLIGHAGLQDNAYHGLENGLANSVDSGRLGQIPIYIMKAGQGGTQIRHWQNGSLYGTVRSLDTLKKRLNAAREILRIKNNGTYPPMYLVWAQGINDLLIRAPTPSGAWKDTTKAFFKRFRLLYGDNIPIFMLRLPAYYDYSGYNQRITEMESEVMKFHAIQTNDAQLLNRNHWNEVGLKLIATRIVQTLTAHYTY